MVEPADSEGMSEHAEQARTHLFAHLNRLLKEASDIEARAFGYAANAFFWQALGALGAVAAVGGTHVGGKNGALIVSVGAVLAVTERAFARLMPSRETARRLRRYAEDLRRLAYDFSVRADTTVHLVADHIHARELARLSRLAVERHRTLAEEMRVQGSSVSAEDAGLETEGDSGSSA